MKFSMSYAQIVVKQAHKFCENQLSDNSAVLKGMTVLLPLLSTSTDQFV
jgi:hypothetical protein